MKKIGVLMAVICVLVFAMPLGGCKGKATVEPVTLRIGVLKDTAQDEMWKQIKKDFETKFADKAVTLDIISTTYLEDAVRPMLDNGTAPDMLFLPTGRVNGLTEELIRDRAILNITDVLDRPVYGENMTLKEKILPGFLETFETNPYQAELSPDLSTYMLPLFYSPQGLFYNKELMSAAPGEGQYKIPESFSAFQSMRYAIKEKNDAAATDAEKLYMYGYGSAADMESLITPMVASNAGIELVEKMLFYDMVYENANIVKGFKALSEINKNPEVGDGMGEFVLKSSLDGVATKNDRLQAIQNKKVMFFSGGLNTLTDLESLDETDYDFSKLGFTAPFAASNSAQSYAKTDFEQIYILKHSQKAELAKEFLLYLYSDAACEIAVKNSGKAMPTSFAIKTAKEKNYISAEKLMIYGVFDGTGVRPISGRFAKAEVEGYSWSGTYINTLEGVFKGTASLDSWIDLLKTTGIKFRSVIL